ncbi:histidine kinase [Ferriphaselus sp. R-1]|uniref:sensor histidine kinase n=1 Tax=Ferriphaselus sp. R-1 TaxID=1485544 RepID=UPI00055347F6|nr:histidine kinase [Ferriphaselus sp. R-1]
MGTEQSWQHRERRSDQRLRTLFAQLLDEQEHDRQRIATELHGGVGQVMSLVKVTLESAAAQIQNGTTDKAEQSIRWLIPIVVDTLADLRRISAELRPSILDDLGLLATLTWFFRRLEMARPDLRIERVLRIEESDVPAVLRITLFRILQETVELLTKDRPTTQIRLELRKHGGTLWLEISGSQPGAPSAPEHAEEPAALPAIRERALLYGGKFAVTHTGSETRISVSWSAKALARYAASTEAESEFHS